MYFRTSWLNDTSLKGAARTRVCRRNIFHCCCVPHYSGTYIRERHLSFLAFSLKNKTILKRWVHVTIRTTFPLNRHPRICSKHFVNAEGTFVPGRSLVVIFGETIYKLEQQVKEAIKVSICMSWRCACHNYCEHCSLVERASVYLRFSLGPWNCFSQPSNFP